MMKPALRSVIVVTCVALVIALLNPPWIDGYGNRSIGFHFISGADFVGYSLTSPTIDYIKLIIIALSICIGAVAAYFIGTSTIVHGVFAWLRLVFKPIAAVFSWLEKYWVVLLMLGVVLKLVLLSK